MPEDLATRPPRRRRRWLLGGVVVLGLLVAAGPTLVGLSPLPDSLLAGAIPPSAGRLSAGSVSLSWTGPLEVSGLRLVDAQGERLFTADRVVVAGGLLDLAMNASAPVDVLVEKPHAELVIGPGGETNFDAIIEAAKDKAADTAGDDPSAEVAKTRRPIAVRVVDGAAMVRDAVSGSDWLFEQLRVDLRDPAQGLDAIQVDAAGSLTPARADLAATGRSGFSLRLGPAEGGGRVIDTNVDSFPLAVVAPLLRGADPTFDLTGVVDLEGRSAWRTPPNTPTGDLTPAGVVRLLSAGGLRSTGVARFSGVTLTTRGESIRLGAVEAPWRIGAIADGLAIQQLEVAADLGRAAVTGALFASEVDRWSTGVGAAPRDLRVAGHVDLDRLAAAAPGLLRVQRDARLESGRVEAAAEFTAGRLAVSLKSGPLTGVAAGRPISWREPLTLRFAALQRAPTAGLAGWELESLLAESTFFDAGASGNEGGLQGDASFDLTRLAEDLAPLVDLRGVRLAGSGEARFNVTRDAEAGVWRLRSNGRLRQLLVGDPAAPLANEPDLRFVVDLDGRLAAPGTLPSGEVSLSAGDDKLTVRLPVAQAAGQGQPFEASLSGDATRWFRRARTAAPSLPAPEAIALAGDLSVSAAGVASPTEGRLDRFSAEVRRLGLDTTRLPSAPVVRLRGEQVKATGQAEWDATRGLIRFARANLGSSVASASLEDLVLSQADPASSRGKANFQIDLAQLARWLPAETGAAPQYAAAGVIGGEALVQGNPEGATIRFDGGGANLSLTDRSQGVVVWSEPELTVNAEATVTPALAVEIRDARVASQMLTGSFGGRIADAANLTGVDLTGGVDYDLERLTPILLPSMGGDVRLVGRDRATFRLLTDESAPRDAPPVLRLRGSVAAPWRSADLFGLPVGSGRLAATLDRGVVRVEPLDVAVGQGRLTLEAMASLDPEPPTLSLRPGPLLADVAVSPAVNERVLKFIAPVLADATRIDGRYSLTLNDFAVPLTPPPPGRPPQGRVTGVLDIHRVQVQPGPSVEQQVALVRQIVGLARDGVDSIAQARNTTLVAIEQSRVNFQMIDGRVYHKGLVFYVGDARVESAGSVGVDETLDLVLSVPILDDWVDRRPVLLGRLRGQALRIPVTGTLDRPKIDRNAFRQLSELIKDAAAGALEKGLNDGLRRLFDKL